MYARLPLVCLLGLSTLLLVSCNRGSSVQAAREDEAPAATPAEQDFMMKATREHIAEIDMAGLAMRKTLNSDVKSFAIMIQNDHTRALADLTDLMKDKNVPQPKTVAADVKVDIEKMNALTGAEFDREFVNTMVADHEKMLEMVREQASIAFDKDVRRYTGDLLPKLESHLDKAQKLQSKLFSGRS